MPSTNAEICVGYGSGSTQPAAWKRSAPAESPPSLEMTGAIRTRVAGQKALRNAYAPSARNAARIQVGRNTRVFHRGAGSGMGFTAFFSRDRDRTLRSE